jgi:hypothetical protein
MRTLGILILLAAAQTPVLAQLSTDQKLEDFRQLIALFDKRYAAYEWARDVFHFDLLDAQPWLDRVAQSQTDLDYYDICAQYVSSLHDGGSIYALPSDFEARLGFSVAMIEGHAFVVTIDRRALPAGQYPFGVGDELVSLDGKDPGQWVKALSAYLQAGSPRANTQAAAALITDRPQILIPHAVDVGDTAAVVVRRITGNVETYTIPWVKTGTPLHAGPVATPKSMTHPAPQADNPAPGGPLLPIYKLPDGFVERLGRSAQDAFFSGTYTAAGRNIGYLRMGSFFPNTGQELTQLDAEVAYFKQNTDGLVIDAWGAGGVNFGFGLAFNGTLSGLQCFVESYASRFLTGVSPTVGYSVRATTDWIAQFESTVNSLRAQGAPQPVIDLAQANLNDVVTTYGQPRGVTGALPLCGLTLTHGPVTDRNGNPTSYNKPIVLLVNELTSGPAELFAAMLQDASRALLFGGPTAGIGTLTGEFLVGSYAEGAVAVSTAVAVRPTTISTADFPPTSFIQNVGVRPDVAYDVFTMDNLATLGAGYVDQFTQTLLAAIGGK